MILAVTALILLPIGAMAQQAANTDPPQISAGHPFGADGKQRQMYEDIEVLRRILNGKLASYACTTCHVAVHTHPRVGQTNYYPASGWAPWVVSGNVCPALARNPHGALGRVDAEGVYFRGKGVVYTLTLPPGRDPKPTSQPEAPKTSTEWERVRQQVRQERPKPEPAPAPREPSVGDILLRVLADNGRHFSKLDADESLSVVVTFRGAPAAGGAVPSGHTAAPTVGEVRRYGSVFQARVAQAQPPTVLQDHEPLADLHLRQGRPADAVRELQQGIEKDPPPQKAAALYRKLSQALLAQKKDEEAVRAAQKAQELAREATSGQPKKDGPAAAPHLPAKLLVSAPKKLLDQVGSGTITFEEFKKQAMMEHLTFSPGQQGPVPAPPASLGALEHEQAVAAALLGAQVLGPLLARPGDAQLEGVAG